MRKLLLITIILICSITGAFAFDSYKNVSIGSNSLPESGNFTFSFKLMENETLYFNLKNKSNYINLDFPTSYYLNNTETYNFTVKWSIIETVIPTDMNLLGVILVTNSLTTNNHTIGLEFNIKKEGNRVLEINGSDELVLRDGIYLKKITFDKLPNNGTMDFFISGNPGEQFHVTGCGKFFVCSNQSFTLNENGGYLFKLGYQIPLAVALGIYNESFNITSQTRNSTIKVQFDVGVPDLLLKPAELGPECFEANAPLRVQVDCEEKFRTWQLETIRAIQSYLSNVNTENICEQLTRTEYVVGNSISELVTQSLKDTIADNTQLRNTNTVLNKQLSTCQADKSSLQVKINETINTKNAEIVQLKDTESQKRVDLFKASEIEKQNEKASTILIMKWFVFVLGLLCFILIALKYVFENVFLIDIRINIWIVGGIGTFFWFCWLGLLVWG